MNPNLKSCFNCRWTRLRTPTEDLSGPAHYWCEKKERYLGEGIVIFDREVCEDYALWDVKSAKKNFGKN